MNILLVNNIASFNSNLALSLSKIQNINAKYIITEENKYLDSNSLKVFLKKYPSRKNLFAYIYYKITFKKQVRRWIEWSDVVYYLWDNIIDEYDLKVAFDSNKKICVEWVGSDIRNPDILSRINPFYNATFNNGYNYKTLESSDFKNYVQEKFARYNAMVFCTPEMSMYIRRDLFPNINLIFQRIKIDHFNPSHFTENKKVRIVHSPTAPEAKGTQFINRAVIALSKKYDFEYIVLTNIARSEVIEQIKKCDIFIDQIIIGSYGMASIEAMSFGKPVLCYLLNQLFELGLPLECPIVNVDPNNIMEKLEELIVNKKLRETIGKRSRKYVEDYHDSDKIALELAKIFINKDE